MTKSDSTLDSWVNDHSPNAQANAKSRGLTAWMEVCFHSSDRTKELSSIREAVKSAREKAHWPVGYYRPTGIEPAPCPDGFLYERPDTSGESYLYWAARSNGDFYALEGLSENENPEHQNRFFFEWSILGIHHSLMFASCLYREIEISEDSIVSFLVSYHGLEGRKFSNINPARRVTQGVSPYNRYEWKQVADTCIGLETNIVSHLFNICDPLFAFFNPGRRPPPAVYADIVNDYRRQVGMKQV